MLKFQACLPTKWFDEKHDWNVELQQAFQPLNIFAKEWMVEALRDKQKKQPTQFVKLDFHFHRC
jgi:hypothetical protein